MIAKITPIMILIIAPFDNFTSLIVVSLVNEISVVSLEEFESTTVDVVAVDDCLWNKFVLMNNFWKSLKFLKARASSPS